MSELVPTARKEAVEEPSHTVVEIYAERAEYRKKLAELGVGETFGAPQTPPMTFGEGGKAKFYGFDAATFTGQMGYGAFIREDAERIARNMLGDNTTPFDEIFSQINQNRSLWGTFTQRVYERLAQRYEDDDVFRSQTDELRGVHAAFLSKGEELKMMHAESAEDFLASGAEKIDALIASSGNFVRVPCSLKEIIEALDEAKTLDQLKQSVDTFESFLDVFSDLSTKNTDAEVQFKLRSLEGAIEKTLQKFVGRYLPFVSTFEHDIPREDPEVLSEFESYLRKIYGHPVMNRHFRNSPEYLAHPDYTQALIPLRAV